MIIQKQKDKSAPFFWRWSKRIPEIFFLDEKDTWSFFLDEKDTELQTPARINR
jgi:hypothetical protein